MSIRALGIISANYEGKGFSQLTLKRTDATIPFGGRYRMIDFALSNMVNSGITTVGLITPYYYRSIMDHVGVGKPWGLARKIGGLFVLPGSVLGERSKGSKVILKDLIRNRRILDSCEAEYVVISDASTIMNLDYQPYIEAHEKDGNTVSVLYKKEEGDEQAIYFRENKKTGLVNEILFPGQADGDKRFLGVIIVNRQYLLDILEWFAAADNEDIVEIFSHELKKIRMKAYEVKCYSMVIDDIKDFKKANADLLDHEVRTELFEQENYQIFTKVQDEAPTIYKKSASVKKSLVAAGCVIEGTVENSIIFRSVHIKKGAVVKNSIIMQGSIIETNATVINAVCDKYSHVGRKAHLEGGTDLPAVLGKNQIL